MTKSARPDSVRSERALRRSPTARETRQRRAWQRAVFARLVFCWRDFARIACL